MVTKHVQNENREVPDSAGTFFVEDVAQFLVDVSTDRVKGLIKNQTQTKDFVSLKKCTNHSYLSMHLTLPPKAFANLTSVIQEKYQEYNFECCWQHSNTYFSVSRIMKLSLKQDFKCIYNNTKKYTETSKNRYIYEKERANRENRLINWWKNPCVWNRKHEIQLTDRLQTTCGKTVTFKLQKIKQRFAVLKQ